VLLNACKIKIKRRDIGTGMILIKLVIVNDNPNRTICFLKPIDLIEEKIGNS